MKKLLVSAALLVFAAAMLASCSQRQKWTAEQRKDMREILHSYREMIYVDDLTDTEFTQFANGVVSALEARYPSYQALATMPAVADTVDVAVVAAIVEHLEADARNIRHVYPYNFLVAQGVLPAGLDHDQQRAFYKCLAGKIYNCYTSERAFVDAIMAGTVEPVNMRAMQAACADELFGWTLTEVDLIESLE